MVEKKAVDRKIVKKKWYSIVAPELFGKEVLGDSLVADKNALLGRNITVNLMTLTGDARRQTTNLHFRIAGFSGDNALAEIVGYELSPSAIKRFIRRDASRIDDSFVCETSDGKFLRVKPMLVTKSKASRPVLSLLKKTLAESLKAEIKKGGYELFVDGVVSNKLQVGLKNGLNKIYPVKVLEIRRFDVVSKK